MYQIFMQTETIIIQLSVKQIEISIFLIYKVIVKVNISNGLVICNKCFAIRSFLT